MQGYKIPHTPDFNESQEGIDKKASDEECSFCETQGARQPGQRRAAAATSHQLPPRAGYRGTAPLALLSRSLS